MPPPSCDISPIPGIFFSFLRANGIRHRVASNVRNLPQPKHETPTRPPLILMLHGFPESWYSWRHQLTWLCDTPVLAVAPDMRGYGSTEQPKTNAQHKLDFVDPAYAQPELAQDVVALAQTLGYDRFVVVGHDWGAQLAWSVALLHPQNVLGVCAMSVPYAGTPNQGLLTLLQKQYGKCLPTPPQLEPVPREIMKKARFHYMLHHCLPYAEQEYDKHRDEFLYRVYAYSKGCSIQNGTPEHDIHGLMFPHAATISKTQPLDATTAPGWWTRMPRPTSLPSWLTQTDLEYYQNEFRRSGFYGALCWYRAADLNFTLMKELLEDGGDRVLPPALFLTGEYDMVNKLYGKNNQQVADRVQANVPNLIREPIFVQDCGHWIQQEKPQKVNEALQDFLETIHPTVSFSSNCRRPVSKL